MKRFVVIVTSILIIFVFIALNYLLWDRESLITLGESNQASIDALSRINMTLNEDKNRLEKQIQDLKDELHARDEQIESLETDIMNQQILMEDKTQFILELKAQINPMPLKNTIIDWIDAVSEKSYSAAFIKSGSSCRFWGNVWSLRLFTDFFDNHIEQIGLFFEDEEQQPMIEVIPSEVPDWEMEVLVHVDIVLIEGVEQEHLVQGENILKFAFTYNERLEQWSITSILTETPESEEHEMNDVLVEDSGE